MHRSVIKQCFDNTMTFILVFAYELFMPLYCSIYSLFKMSILVKMAILTCFCFVILASIRYQVVFWASIGLYIFLAFSLSFHAYRDITQKENEKEFAVE